MKKTIRPRFTVGRASYYEGDCFEWLRHRRARSIHGVVTDPPYGLVEYTPRELERRRQGNGVWRLPPKFDGYDRAPLPRFTELTRTQVEALYDYFLEWGKLLLPVLAPGAHVMTASNPLLQHMLLEALHDAGFERRGQIIRLVHTMRGGDRPKLAHTEFPETSVMPRSMHEPWVLFRKPLEGSARENLRKWGTGGLRRPSVDQPFVDVIVSSPAGRSEKALAPHPTLKPQAFMRQVVRAILPLGRGVVLDPFAGSGSTLAAAQAVGYRSIGIESDPHSTAIAKTAVRELARFTPSEISVERRRKAKAITSGTERQRSRVAVA